MSAGTLDERGSVRSTRAMVKLRNLCERITKGSTPTSYGLAYTTEGIRFIKAENIDSNGIASTTTDYIDEGTNDFLKRSVLQESDLLFSIAGTIGRVGLIRSTDLPANTNQALAIVRLRLGALDPKYLFYYLKSDAIQKQALKRIVGVGRANLSLSELGDLDVPLVSIESQKKIVAEIEKQFSRLDEAVANLKRVKANLKRYKAAVLKAAVEGRLVPTEAELARREGRSYETGAQLLQRIFKTRRSQWKGKGKYGEPAAPDAYNRPDIPNGWQWANVDQLAQVGTGATPSRGRADYYDGGTVPWVTSAVVNERYVDQPSELVTVKALAETNLTLYPAGTLIVAMYGEGKTRGKCAELRISATTNQALAALRVDPQVCSYLKMFLEYNYEETRKVASGGVQPNLNLGLVRSIPVPLPPLTEQHRIVAEVDRRLSLVREVEAEVDANMMRANGLRQAVLTREFSGKTNSLVET